MKKTKIDLNQVSIRVSHVLMAMNVFTVEELAQKTYSEIKRHRNIGKKTVNEIRFLLKEHGLRLQKDAGADGPKVARINKLNDLIANNEAKIYIIKNTIDKYKFEIEWLKNDRR